MKIKLFFIIFFIFSNINAQEIEKKDNFYKQNFAKEVLKNQQQNEETKTVINENKKNILSNNFDRTTNVIDKKTDMFESKKIKWLGLIIKMDQEKHFLENLDNLIGISDRYEIDIAKVYAIGDFSSKYNNYSSKIYARGEGGISYQNHVPKKFEVKLSPTWLIATEEGLIILEGLKLERYINAQGQFVENQEFFEEKIDSF